MKQDEPFRQKHTVQHAIGVRQRRIRPRRQPVSLRGRLRQRQVGDRRVFRVYDQRRQKTPPKARENRGNQQHMEGNDNDGLVLDYSSEDDILFIFLIS